MIISLHNDALDINQRNDEMAHMVTLKDGSVVERGVYRMVMVSLGELSFNQGLNGYFILDAFKDYLFDGKSPTIKDEDELKFYGLMDPFGKIPDSVRQIAIASFENTRVKLTEPLARQECKDLPWQEGFRLKRTSNYRSHPAFASPYV